MPNLFPPLIRDDLGPFGRGVTNPRLVRAEDGLVYLVKSDCPEAPSCRASEYIWLSIARAIGIAVPSPPTVIAQTDGSTLLGVRFETESLRDHQAAAGEMLAGKLHDGTEQLSKIFAFDLFSGNFDRHAANYLVLQSFGKLIVMAIDFSHVPANPGEITQSRDPAINGSCNTRQVFPILIKPYLQDEAAVQEAVTVAIGTLERISKISDTEINAILGNFPEDWLPKLRRSEIARWWASPARSDRVNQLKTGIKNGSYL